jgi:hypothetical protein
MPGWERDPDPGLFPDLFDASETVEHSALPPAGRDLELDWVRDWLLHRDPDGARFGAVLRESLDQVLDGPRTGRFRYADLHKTEKTHIGTIVEINIAKEFELLDGDVTDYRVDGIQVDCKYSMSKGQWAIPIEAITHLMLLVWADDEASRWSVGLWRVDSRHLNAGENRDSKKTIAKAGRSQIAWLWDEAPLDENLLLHLDPPTLEAIFSHTGKRSGQERVNELFRRVQHRIVRREVVLTVAQQKDAPRRARMAREPRYLGREGIVVLGHYAWDVDVATALDLPVPKSGEWLSTRLCPVPVGSERPSFFAAGQRWAVATVDDSVVPAPVVPRGNMLSEE